MKTSIEFQPKFIQPAAGRVDISTLGGIRANMSEVISIRVKNIN